MSDETSPLIIAHRGASADHPENTRDAFLGAAEQGADWVELDVRHTDDGSLIVNHDPWYRDKRLVWSTPSSERPVEVLDLAAALDACIEGTALFDGTRSGGTRSGSVAMGVNVEIKNSFGDLGGDGVPRTMEVVHEVVELLISRRRAGIVEEILISSFDPETIDRVRALGGPPTAQLLLDPGSWPDLVTSTVERGHSFIHPWDQTVDQALVDEAHVAGLGVNVWTVDDPGRIAALAAMGVDGVVTNVPAIARGVFPDS